MLTENIIIQERAGEEYKKVLEEKLIDRLNANRSKVQESLLKIEKEGMGITDHIVPITPDLSHLKFHSNGSVKAILSRDAMYNVHPHAIGQIAEKYNVPSRYLKEKAESQNQWERDLAVHVMNEHIKNGSKQRVLMRSVNGQVKGFLSDSYRRMNSAKIYSRFLQMVQSNGGIVMDASATDTKTFIETILPDLIEVPTAKNGKVYLAIGARISSSDFGDGALELRTFIMQAVCLNGMVSNSVLKQIHLGSKLPDDIKISERTYELDTETQASLVSDMVKQLYSPDSIVQKAKLIQKASEKEVDLENEIKKLPKLGILKEEVEQVQQVLMNNREEDGVQGEGTMWKFAQAVSAIARDKDERRKREIDEIAGKLIL